MNDAPATDGDGYRSPLMELPGASSVRGAESHPDFLGVAWHYGNPLGEQRAFHEGLGFIDRSQRRILAVSGPERHDFLNKLLTQHLDDLAPGESTFALDLDAQGRILHDMAVAATSDTIYLDLVASHEASMLDYLRRMIFWSQVTVEPTDLAPLMLIGPDAPSCTVADSLAVARRGDTLLVPRPQLREAARLLIDAGATPTGLMALQAERVRALWPLRSVDLDEKSIPHESATLIKEAVHLNKGCYRGQETVARVDNLGRSPRVAVMLLLDGSAPDLPSRGEAVTLGGRTVGHLGTVVQDFELGPIALALVKRSALPTRSEEGPTPPLVTLTIGDVTASVDPDSLPVEHVGAGRKAVENLRKGR